MKIKRRRDGRENKRKLKKIIIYLRQEGKKGGGGAERGEDPLTECLVLSYQNVKKENKVRN